MTGCQLWLPSAEESSAVRTSTTIELPAGTDACGSVFQLTTPHSAPGKPASWMVDQLPWRSVWRRAWKPVMSL